MKIAQLASTARPKGIGCAHFLIRSVPQGPSTGSCSSGNRWKCATASEAHRRKGSQVIFKKGIASRRPLRTTGYTSGCGCTVPINELHRGCLHMMDGMVMLSGSGFGERRLIATSEARTVGDHMLIRSVFYALR